MKNVEETLKLGVALTPYRVADAIYRKLNPTERDVAPALRRHSTFVELEGENVQREGSVGFRAEIPQGVLEVYAEDTRASYQATTHFRVVVTPHSEKWFPEDAFKAAVKEVRDALGPLRIRGRA